ncbi:MAG: hypothetical protein FRX49_04370 [Trebouxia sp. A1-2]|nr:MAG: hypothetical protein FRX49_04370 [Trebouxia sp. A1-2]
MVQELTGKNANSGSKMCLTAAARQDVLCNEQAIKKPRSKALQELRQDPIGVNASQCRRVHATHETARAWLNPVQNARCSQKSCRSGTSAEPGYGLG